VIQVKDLSKCLEGFKPESYLRLQIDKAKNEVTLIVCAKLSGTQGTAIVRCKLK
jgi:sortase (surface protein transpeptidase)